MRMLKKTENGPFLIHCQHGADRTGLMSAMYRMLEQDWTRGGCAGGAHRRRLRLPLDVDEHPALRALGGRGRDCAQAIGCSADRLDQHRHRQLVLARRRGSRRAAARRRRSRGPRPRPCDPCRRSSRWSDRTRSSRTADSTPPPRRATRRRRPASRSVLAHGRVGAQVAADVARRQAARAQAGDHEVREVLADAAARLEHLGGRACRCRSRPART